MVPRMTGQFYDKVTKKFGTFQGVPRPLTTYPQGNPEEMFEQKLFELSGKDKVALDLGCGDGRFTLRMAVYFREIVGIDSSVERLKLAQAEQRLQRAGFEVVYRQDVLYDEYFASYHDLDVFLQGVPIFEDFDSEKDRLSLEAYVARFQTDKGIHLPRHRFLFAAVKS